MEFNTIKTILEDNCCYTGRSHHGLTGWSLEQSPHEAALYFEFLRNHFGDNPINYLEIGIKNAGMVRAVKEFLNVATCVTMDIKFPVEGDANFDIFHKNIAYGNLNLTRECDSHSDAAVEFLSDAVGLEYDLVFIDGDHSYEGVKQDFELCLPFIKKGGLVAFHDTLISTPTVGTKRFNGEMNEKYENVLNLTHMFGISVFKVEE